jgi:hypothetical protein
MSGASPYGKEPHGYVIDELIDLLFLAKSATG